MSAEEREGAAENTSTTSDWCHKTVKLNQCHIERAAFRRAHMHPPQIQ